MLDCRMELEAQPRGGLDRIAHCVVVVVVVVEESKWYLAADQLDVGIAATMKIQAGMDLEVDWDSFDLEVD